MLAGRGAILRAIARRPMVTLPAALAGAAIEQ
jgi:hypothetical protein